MKIWGIKEVTLDLFMDSNISELGNLNCTLFMDGITFKTDLEVTNSPDYLSGF